MPSRFKKEIAAWTNVGLNPIKELMFIVPMVYPHGDYVDAWFHFSLNNVANVDIFAAVDDEDGTWPAYAVNQRLAVGTVGGTGFADTQSLVKNTDRIFRVRPYPLYSNMAWRPLHIMPVIRIFGTATAAAGTVVCGLTVHYLDA